jgi:hypothetical protein
MKLSENILCKYKISCFHKFFPLFNTPRSKLQINFISNILVYFIQITSYLSVLIKLVPYLVHFVFLICIS